MRNTQRLDKILSNFGYGSRKEIKELLKRGIIRVDGIVVNDGAVHINPECSTVEIGKETLQYRQFIYVMLNKPDGVVSATNDKKLKTVVDILPDKLKCFDLFPVGRLDIDTEGLLIMTNDGQLAHDLLSPVKHVPKKYYAVIKGTVTIEDKFKFKEGIILDDGYKAMPADLSILRAGESSEIEIVLHEGKFHQVKRMFEAVDKKVDYLRRIEMGNLILDEGLKTGECRELSDTELFELKNHIEKQNKDR